MNGQRNRQMQILMPWLVTVAMFLVWEVACRLFDVPQFILPAPSKIVAAMAEFPVPIMQNALQTLFTTVIGFAPR